MGGQSLYDDLAYVKLELDNVAWLQCEGAWSRQSYGHCRTLINLLSPFAFAEFGPATARARAANTQRARNKLRSPALTQIARHASND